MRDPQTDQLLTEVRQAVVNARAGGATVRACIFNATVAAVDESARAWPSAEARRTADNACRAVEPPTAKAGPVPAAVAPATDRAAVLSEAADDLAEFIALHGPTSRTVAGWRGAIGFLRRLAAEVTPAVPAVPVSSPPPDQTALEERVARRLAGAWISEEDWQRYPESFRAEYLAYARDVLAFVPLPPPADRAAVYRDAADTAEAMNEGCGQRKPCASCDARTDAADALRDIARRLAAEAQQQVPQASPEWCKCRSCWGWFVEEHPGEDLDELSKDLGWWSGAPEHRDPPTGVAAEAQQPDTETQPEWARPETEEEKLAKARRMAKALSAPPVAPPEWASTREWPNRHKRRGDRRVHATAPFESGVTRQFWTACEKPIGKGGYPLSHMAVDCRDCKRAITAVPVQPAADGESPPVHKGGNADD